MHTQRGSWAQRERGPKLVLRVALRGAFHTMTLSLARLKLSAVLDVADEWCVVQVDRIIER